MKQTPIYEAHKPSKFLTGTALFTILVAIFLIVFGVTSYLQNQETKSKLDEQVARTEKLAQEIKKLAEDNGKTSQRNANYAYCNAYLFAKYTQDGMPIVIEDLNKCVVTVFPNDEGAPTIPTEGFQAAQGNVQGSSSSSTAPGATPQRSTAPQSTAQSPQSPSQPRTQVDQQSALTIQPSTISPSLSIVPDVQIPGILEIR